jgi:hypothetical protein
MVYGVLERLLIFHCHRETLFPVEISLCFKFLNLKEPIRYIPGTDAITETSSMEPTRSWETTQEIRSIS